MTKTASVLLGEDGIQRCWWCGSDPLYMKYHDQEWGVPVGNDQRLFEKMCLEGFQAGLSWITILKKREAFREDFLDFDYRRVAKFDSKRVELLLQDARIVRHRGKIESTINNAARAMEIIDEFGSLGAFFWQFEPKKSPVIQSRNQIVPKTEASIELSKALKRRGWTFVGPTTCYALMQAMGMVNDHVRSCPTWPIIQRARKQFVRPK